MFCLVHFEYYLLVFYGVELHVHLSINMLYCYVKLWQVWINMRLAIPRSLPVLPGLFIPGSHELDCSTQLNQLVIHACTFIWITTRERKKYDYNYFIKLNDVFFCGTFFKIRKKNCLQYAEDDQTQTALYIRSWSMIS